MARNPNTKCSVCMKPTYIRPKILKKSKSSCCSRECSNIARTLDSLMRNTQTDTVNEGFSLLYHDYYNNKLSYRLIAEKYNTKKGNIQGLFNGLGLKPRNRSDAVKTQWINNPERRKQASKTAKKYLINDVEVRKKAIDLSRTEKSRLKVSKSKQGKNNPMYGVIGEDHPNWNPNLTQDDREDKRNDVKHTKWSRDTKERDNYTCQVCYDDKGGNLISHHLESYNSNVKLRYDIDNGVTLCEECHINFHKEYGFGNNTRLQYREWRDTHVR